MAQVFEASLAEPSPQDVGVFQEFLEAGATVVKHWTNSVGRLFVRG